MAKPWAKRSRWSRWSRWSRARARRYSHILPSDAHDFHALLGFKLGLLLSSVLLGSPQFSWPVSPMPRYASLCLEISRSDVIRVITSTNAERPNARDTTAIRRRDHVALQSALLALRVATSRVATCASCARSLHQNHIRPHTTTRDTYESYSACARAAFAYFANRSSLIAVASHCFPFPLPSRPDRVSLSLSLAARAGSFPTNQPELRLATQAIPHI